MQQRKKFSLPSLPVKRVPLATTTNTPSKKLLQDHQQETQKSHLTTPIKQSVKEQVLFEVSREVISKAVEAASPASSSTSSSSNTTSSTFVDDNDLTFESPLPANAKPKKSINKNEPILQQAKKDSSSDTDKFELTEDDAFATPLPTTCQTKTQKSQAVFHVDVSTNTMFHLDVPKTENEEILHLQAQVHRLQQENSRLSEESSFFRIAANSMKQQAILGKQQLMSQLAFFCEPLMREAIETDFDHSMRETFRTLFDLERGSLEMKREFSAGKKSLEMENRMMMIMMGKKNNRLLERRKEETGSEIGVDPQTLLLQSQNESLKKDLVQANLELSQLQSSVKEMSRSWQERFNILRKENETLESTLEEARQELVSVKNVSDFRSRRKAELQRKFVDVAVDVNREVMFSNLDNQETSERCTFVSQQENEQRQLLALHFERSSALVTKMFVAKKESEKSVSTFSAEAAKYKQRSDRVTGECDRLVEENKKLHDELKGLRRELYRV